MPEGSNWIYPNKRDPPANWKILEAALVSWESMGGSRELFDWHEQRMWVCIKRARLETSKRSPGRQIDQNPLIDWGSPF